MYALLQQRISKRLILRLVSEATLCMIAVTRRLKRKGGTWTTPNPYIGKKANAKDVRVALEYYTHDDLARFVQSPSKKDVIIAVINDKKNKIAKRFMTRSEKKPSSCSGRTVLIVNSASQICMPWG